ncbi:MAG TPA: N-acetyltransferase [Candidatus Eremiobacteraceae bacterium]|nr:N-acetyltransferase [Candidatus Eremiobacteraceae bacterium]
MSDAVLGEITIDEADDDDREWCAQLMASSEPWLTLGRTIDQTRPLFHRTDSELYVARRDGMACGFLLLRDRGIIYSPYIASLAVSPDSRGLGIGGRLLDFVEKRARESSKHIFLCVSSFNTRAQVLYDRHGYAVVGELKDYIVDGFSEYLMSKRLR